jgi:hypothetical protein
VEEGELCLAEGAAGPRLELQHPVSRLSSGLCYFRRSIWK